MNNSTISVINYFYEFLWILLTNKTVFSNSFDIYNFYEEVILWEYIQYVLLQNKIISDLYDLKDDGNMNNMLWTYVKHDFYE